MRLTRRQFRSRALCGRGRRTAGRRSACPARRARRGPRWLCNADPSRQFHAGRRRCEQHRRRLTSRPIWAPDAMLTLMGTISKRTIGQCLLLRQRRICRRGAQLVSKPRGSADPALLRDQECGPCHAAKIARTVRRCALFQRCRSLGPHRPVRLGYWRLRSSDPELIPRDDDQFAKRIRPVRHV